MKLNIVFSISILCIGRSLLRIFYYRQYGQIQSSIQRLERAKIYSNNDDGIEEFNLDELDIDLIDESTMDISIAKVAKKMAGSSVNDSSRTPVETFKILYEVSG
jgi:hypothetical protein